MAEDVNAVMATIPVPWRRRWCGGEDGDCACMGCVQVGNRLIMVGLTADKIDPEWIDERRVGGMDSRGWNMTVKCPVCGHEMRHLELGEHLECWECDKCGEIVDISDVKELEFKIQNLLLDFVNKHGCGIDYVYVDTRNFANLKVEIQ